MTMIRQHVRALAAATALDQSRHSPTPAFQQSDLAALQPYMLLLMLRNVTSAGFVVEDPAAPGQYSAPGCVIAAPSFPANTPGVDQDYVFNWVRDAAITAIEIAEAKLPPAPGGGVQPLIDYVTFAQACQSHAQPTLGHACFTIAGQPRPWTEQNDGPALQSIAMLRAYKQLDPATQAIAAGVIALNLGYLLNVYQQETTNLWEEHSGLSFFARSAQLRCFREVAANSVGIVVPQGVGPAITWLETALQGHWNGSYYISMLAPGGGPPTSIPNADGYDPNIDIVCASLYGGVPCTDTQLLATVARLYSQWADSASTTAYPINQADQAQGVGPLFGRYPGDVYDGDVSHPVEGGHPWALCTCNVAELQYRLAAEILRTKSVPLDDLSKPFFDRFGVDAKATPAAAAVALRSAGDTMLRAVIYHSAHYELSEQFDGTTGFEKSVRNLTWSYASFLSALRARATPAPVSKR